MIDSIKAIRNASTMTSSKHFVVINFYNDKFPLEHVILNSPIQSSWFDPDLALTTAIWLA